MKDSTENGKSVYKKWRNQQLFRLRAFLLRKPANREQALDSLRWLQKQQLLRTDTLHMIEEICSISETRVKDVMVPRPNMVTIQDDAKLDDIVEAITSSGHSRFPVVDGSLDKISGVLLAKDLLQYLKSEPRERFNIQSHIRPAVIVPESKRINILLNEFRRSRNHMAIVVDEYSGICGLVTIEDVLEEIVGEISDEHDLASDHYVHADEEGNYVIKALTPLEYFNRFFSMSLRGKSVDTIGGLVVETLKRVPKHKEKLHLQGVTLEVFQSDPRRVHSLIIRKSR